MKLFGASLSPYVRKVMIYAAEKGLDIELRQVGLGQPDPEFRACSPFGKLKRVSRPRQPGAAIAWTVYEYDEFGRTCLQLPQRIGRVRAIKHGRRYPGWTSSGEMISTSRT